MGKNHKIWNFTQIKWFCMLGWKYACTKCRRTLWEKNWSKKMLYEV